MNQCCERGSWAAPALAALCLIFLASFSSGIRAEEPGDDGRVPLYIKAGDPNGGKLSFTWKQVEGPTVKIADPTASRSENGKWVSDTYFIPTEPGKYAFEVTVRNENGDESKKIIVRPVLPPAPPPTADAGKDKTDVRVGEIVRINGVGSKAAEGRSISEWEWRVLQAPEKFKLDPRLLTERSFDFKAEYPGLYEFGLKVKDGKRWSEPSTVKITVKTNSKPPEIEAPSINGIAQELPGEVKVVKSKPEVKPVVSGGGNVKIGDVVTLDGSKSVVDEKAKPEFFWHQESGPFVRELVPDRTRPFVKSVTDPLNYPVWLCKPDKAGEYSFVLEITARDGKNEPFVTKSQILTFTVTAPEPVPPPKENPKVTQEDPKPPVQNKNDPPAVDDKKTADIVDLDKPPKAQPNDTPKKGGPTAKIFAERRTVEVGDMVKLDGSRSVAANAGKLEYIWGPVPNKRFPKQWSGTEGPRVEFRADEEGEYGVALVVKEGEKFSEPIQETITVGPANQAPIIKLARKFECVTGEQLSIEAEVHDPENDKIDVKWSCVDPTDLVIPDRLAKYYDPANRLSKLVFVPKNPGTYVFQVVATDAKGKSETAKTQVGVKEAQNRPPTAIIDGAPSKPILPNTPVRLNGMRSSDPEKKTLTYFWKQEADSAKIPGKVPGEKDKAWDFTPTEPGKYIVTLVVSDGVNKSEPDKVEIVVERKNMPPVANISGPPGNRIILGEEAVLDGSGSADSDNDKLTFKWRKIESKGDVELGPDNQEKLTVKAKTLGSVRVALIVNDGQADSEPAYVDLSVVRPNKKPVAKITGPETAKIGTFVELSAAESSDPDGDEITYVWSQAPEGGPEIGVRGRDLRKKSIRFRPEKPGSYVVSLEVVDAEGLKSDPVTHKVEVKGLNRPPRAVAARIGTEAIAVGAEVKLSARGSLDPDGGPITYKWKQLSGDPIKLADDASEILNIVPNAPGLYEFECIVNDGENDSAPAKVSFEVKAPNRPPVAVIGEIVAPEPGDKIWLDGSASKDADGDRLEYKWAQVSGPEVKFPWRGANKPKVEVTIPKEGEYVFELKVGDGKEWSEPAKVAVKTRATNQPPVAAVTMSELRTEEGVETTLDASASSDPDNGPQPLHFVWKQLTGARVDLHAEGSLAKFTAKRAGTMSFEVRASDGKSDSAPATVHVEVLKAGTLPVAVPDAKPNPIKVAQKGKNDTNILILDGTKSRSKTGTLTYMWKQVAGEDLRLRPQDLSKSRVGIRIFLPGTYRFMLTVSDGQNTSMPAYIDVKVIDDSAPQTPPAPATNKESSDEPAEKKTGAAKTPPPRESAAPKDTRSEFTAPVQKTPSAPTVNESKTASEDGALLPPPKDASAGANKSNSDMDELSRKNDPDAEKALIQALSSEDPDIRSAAATALYRRGINSIPALIGVLEKGDATARKEAHWALRELTHETLGQDAEKWKAWWAKQPASKTMPVSSVNN